LRTHSTYDDPKFIGQRFGRLTVEEVVRRPGKTALFWKCRDWDGEKMKLSDWCEKYGVKYVTANKAYHNGWDLHRYVSA